MLTGYLSHDCAIDRVVAATATGTSAVNGDILDMSGYDAVCFILAIGATDGTPGLKAQQGADSGLSDAADLANTAVLMAATDDNKLCVLDLVDIQERYVRCVATRAGGTGTVLDGGIAVRYRAHSVPVTQPSDVAAVERHNMPAEGTA